MDRYSLECNAFQVCNGFKILKNCIEVMSTLFSSGYKEVTGHVLSATIAQRTKDLSR